jgi:delta1-piperideine-2-carboxylate reductase
MSLVVHVPFPELVELLFKILVRHGVAQSSARLIAANCAACERDGSLSHGIFRIPGYVASLRNGWIDGQAVPELEDIAPSLLRCDARNGFAQVALDHATGPLLEKVAANGLALLLIRNSHHFSALWPDVEPFAERGLSALCMVNSMACVVPHGGKKAVYGTNPVAFAIPREDGMPFIFDQASSAIAHGDVQIAAKEGRELAADHGVDADGNATRDPAKILDGGALLPFGGHKGASIALMVELLSAGLSGGAFSHQVDWSEHPGAQTPRTGQFLLLIDGQRGNPGNLAARVESLLQLVEDSGQSRLPGQRRRDMRKHADRYGIPIAQPQLKSLNELMS